MKPALLWIARSFLLLVLCGSGRTSHIKLRLYTALFKASVGDVGNRGRLSLLPPLFSKTPHLHRHDLENSPPEQIAQPTQLETDFHFSGCTTGITTLCIYFYLYKSSRRALLCCLTRQNSLARQTHHCRPQKSNLSTNQNQMKIFCFVATTNPHPHAFA